MPFISDRENRSIMQGIIPDDGSVPADFSEVFSASVGFAFDEGLSVSRALNSEMYQARRDAARKVFDSGVERSLFTEKGGHINYDRMSLAYPEIKTNAALAEEKKALLAGRRAYYNDVMRRSDSTAAEFLGSANAFMLDPVNVATMGVGTPFAVAKSATVLGKVLSGAAGGVLINVGTEALIQPMVLDYKLDIDSPYGAEDAIANIAMAAGGGALFGGTVGGISGWLGKIRGDVDKVKVLPEGVDLHEVHIALRQVDDMIETLKNNPETVSRYPGFDDATIPREGLLGRGAIKLKDGTILIDDSAIHAQQLAKLGELGVSPKDIESGGFIRQDGSYIEGSADTPRILAQEKAKLSIKERRGESVKSKVLTDDELNTKQIESEANYLRKLEEEKTRINSHTATEKPHAKVEIDDAQIEEVHRAIDKPVLAKDGQFVSAKEIIDEFDSDIQGLEALRTCLLG